MSNGDLNWIANFIWGIADDVLRDLYVRGKYRDVILPMTVLRRLDAELEETKQAGLDMKTSPDEAAIVHQDPALRQAAGHWSVSQNVRVLPCDHPMRAGEARRIASDWPPFLGKFTGIHCVLGQFWPKVDRALVGSRMKTLGAKDAKYGFGRRWWW